MAILCVEINLEKSTKSNSQNNYSIHIFKALYKQAPTSVRNENERGEENNNTFVVTAISNLFFFHFSLKKELFCMKS